MTDNGPFTGTAVHVVNWKDAPKAPEPVTCKKTTLKTWALQGSGVAPGDTLWKQICDYEPNRTRLVIQVYDQDIDLTTEVPVHSPDVDVAGQAPQGRFLPASNTVQYIFYGPDAFYINPLNAAGARVTVTKEYK